MITIANENLVSLSDASRKLPKFGGKHPHPSTIFRWCKTGIHNVKLEYINIGGRMATSIEALDRFIQQTSESAAPTTTPTTTPKDKDTQITDTLERLEREGI